MTKINEDSHSSEWTKTAAHTNFESNLVHLKRLLKIVSANNLKGHLSSLDRLTKKLSREVKKVSKGTRDDLGGRLSDITERMKDVTVGINEFTHLYGFLWAWMSVMLIAFVEAYMEENLDFIARKNPNLLNNTDPLSFDRVFEANSLEDLKAELRQQWGKKTLRGGPEKWAKRLQELGARGYKKDCIFRMQHLWDTRNLIVHAQGIADRVYLKKYKMNVKSGERVRVASNLFSWWLEGLKDFIEVTDQFFSRYGSTKNSRKAI